ncbi:MAG: sigma 54-interacting transcriptional regulator [Deltaproteobacteria bacterium]|nr:sigma 54-interacting transcriptional regulator [Deltaproteobacteria bacterium]MBF0524536.1 sigma 54-interacting transcriptional regulator [Deltaproteobacteria bacterium]
MLRLVRYLDDTFKLAWFDLANIRSFHIRTKLLMGLIPSTILILIATGYVTNWYSKQFLNEAVERSVRIQALAVAHEISGFLNLCQEDLLELAQLPMSAISLEQFWTVHQHMRGWSYTEVAFIAPTNDNSIFLAGIDDKLVQVPPPEIPFIRPSTADVLADLQKLGRDEVLISPVVEGIYPLPSGKLLGRNTVRKIIRFSVMLWKPDGRLQGVLMLGVDAHRVRDILSLYNSPQSPIFAYVRSPEVRYCYMFDKDGWMLFQSEELDDKPKELSAETARTGLSGIFGKPGLERAFKPDIKHNEFWQMVGSLQSGKPGLITIQSDDSGYSTGAYLVNIGYAPVRFKAGLDRKADNYAGVAFVDRSRLGLWAGYRQVDVIFVVSLFTMIMIAFVIYVLSRVITRPIFDLAAAVNRIQETGELREIVLQNHDFETNFLRFSINNMINTIKNQLEEIRLKDVSIQEVTQGRPAILEEDRPPTNTLLLAHDVGDIIGSGPVIESLKVGILKAASVDADVLIIGETGTGKQLTAEAVHKYSVRAAKAFISINCGALDENLLLDSLFGHTKGAFTEAKTDRKGAFLAAHGGTLFLDEIGTASPKVQQALLRTLSIRKVTPLGSDREFDVDVRVITATNEELKELVDKGRFREDLYYRLNVITIRTPALRDHKENIPTLANHFLRQASIRMEKEYVALTQGALEKLLAHIWPGNVRELRNCIIRAVAMAEGQLIYINDIRLEEERTPPAVEPFHLPTEVFVSGPSAEEKPSIPLDLDLNERQKKAFSIFFEKGEITRVEYQQAVGNGFPSRTALNDLQDMVKKGILKRTGHGPATRYCLVKEINPNA